MATIDLNRLTLFTEVAERGSFSAAAAHLGLPKSSVSRGVAALERELGVRLLQRTTRSVALSTSGAELFERIAPQLDALRRSLGDLPAREEQPAGLLRVNTLHDVGAAFVAELVTRFAIRHPAIQVELRLDQRPVDLVAERVDVALRIMTKPLRDSSLAARRLGHLRLQLFAAPDYLARRGTPRAAHELAAHDWVGLRGVPALLLQGPGRARLPPMPAPRIVCDDGATTLAAVRAAGGLAVLPSFLAEPAVARGQLARVLPRWGLPNGHLWFVCPSARQIPKKVTAFRDFLIEELARRPLLTGQG